MTASLTAMRRTMADLVRGRKYHDPSPKVLKAVTPGRANRYRHLCHNDGTILPLADEDCRPTQRSVLRECRRGESQRVLDRLQTSTVSRSTGDAVENSRRGNRAQQPVV